MRARKPVSAEAALERMRVLCARSEQCSGDVAEKLRRLGISGGDARRIIDELEAGRYIDDGRYARAFAYSMMQFSGWGRRKIRLALCGKHIASGVIRDSVEELKEDEYEAVLERVLSVKARGVDIESSEGRNKVYRSMIARGFESEKITEAIRRLRERRKEDEDRGDC